MDNLEIRTVQLDDVSTDTQKRTITGRAVVYNSESKQLRTNNGTTFRETILPGALTDSLKNNDIRALVEHDPAKILGRTSAGTLKLEDRDDGLYCSIDVPDTSYGNDMLVSAKRGDLKGFSFGFNPTKQRTYTKGGEKIRELSALDIREVSIVGSPAYGATTLAVRDSDFVEEEKRTEAPVTPVVEAKVEEKRAETPSVDMELLRMKHRHNKNKLRGSSSCKQTPNK